MSTVVLTDLLYGAARSNRQNHHRALVNDLRSRLVVLPFDEAAADHAGRGAPIGPNDLLIAGHARSLGLKLVTGNLREFGRVEGLRCEDWLG